MGYVRMLSRLGGLDDRETTACDDAKYPEPGAILRKRNVRMPRMRWIAAPFAGPRGGAETECADQCAAVGQARRPLARSTRRAIPARIASSVPMIRTRWRERVMAV